MQLAYNMTPEFYIACYIARLYNILEDILQVICPVTKLYNCTYNQSQCEIVEPLET